MAQRQLYAIFTKTNALKNCMSIAPRYSTRETRLRDKDVNFHPLSKGQRIKQELRNAQVPRTDDYDKNSSNYSPIQINPSSESEKDKDSSGAATSGAQMHAKEKQMEKDYWGESSNQTPGEKKEVEKKKTDE